jgi:hypothetical protein
MAKSSVQNIIDEVKGDGDYNIIDTDLDDILLKSIKRHLQSLKQLLINEGLSNDITAESSFKTVEDQEWVDITQARIVGNVASFTGIANDKLKVSVDGTDYDNIDVSGDTSIADVVSSINTAVGSTVASESDDGYLVITSLTTGTASSVTIADGSGSGQTVVGDLFSTAAERTQDAITDVDEIIYLHERTNDCPIEIIPIHRLRRLMIDPSADTSTTPYQAALHRNYIYFRPRPTSNEIIYIDYYIDVAAITTSSDMPYKDKYDPVIVALVKKDLLKYLGKTKQEIDDAQDDINYAISTLITNASNDLAEERQLGSRYEEEPYFAPRKPVEMGS